MREKCDSNHQIMKAYTYIDKGRFALMEKPEPKILDLIEQGLIDTTPLITHRYKLEDIDEAYRLFEERIGGVIKVAIEC